MRDSALITLLAVCSADGLAQTHCSRYPDLLPAQADTSRHTLAAVIGEADVRRARRYLHRAEDDLNAALASLRDADLTATARDELAGLGTELLLKTQILTDMLSAEPGNPRRRDSLIRALDRENAALRYAVRQVLLAMDAGQITELEAAHLIADAVDLHRSSLRLLMQAFEADQNPDAGDPASRC
jgi:hypothetical protein